MASSLSKLVNNLSEGVHKIKCKYQHDDENLTNHATVYFNKKNLRMI